MCSSDLYGGALKDQHGDLYFWLPIVAPLLGGLLGGALFKFLIEDHLTDPEAEGIDDTRVSESRPND